MRASKLLLLGLMTFAAGVAFPRASFAQTCDPSRERCDTTTTRAAPELDPETASAALMLLAGAVLLLRERRAVR
jgi:uncharacterized protein (TIGR03382 family)